MIPRPVFLQDAQPAAPRLAFATQPARLRRIAAEAARYYRQIGTRRDPLQFTWLGRTWQLSLSLLTGPAEIAMDELHADWGGSPLRIRLDTSLLAAAHGHLLGGRYAGDADGETLAVLTEAALEPVFDLVEQATRKRFSLISAMRAVAPDALPEAVGKPAVHGYMLQLADGETTYRLELWLDALGLGFMANALRSWPAADPDAAVWSMLPVPVYFCVGWTILPLSSVRSLARHDVVLLDECLAWGGMDRLMVRISDHWAVEAQIEGMRVRVTTEPERIMDEFEEEQGDDFDDNRGGARLDDLPVRLQFDLGERTLPLAELQTVGPGFVFELGRELRRAVTIRANGRAIGDGELVEVDGQVGVLIRQLLPSAA